MASHWESPALTSATSSRPDKANIASAPWRMARSPSSKTVTPAKPTTAISEATGRWCRVRRLADDSARLW